MSKRGKLRPFVSHHDDDKPLARPVLDSEPRSSRQELASQLGVSRPRRRRLRLDDELGLASPEQWAAAIAAEAEGERW